MTLFREKTIVFASSSVVNNDSNKKMVLLLLLPNEPANRTGVMNFWFDVGFWIF